MDTTPEHHLFWQGETPLTCVSRIEETPDTTTFVLAAATRQFFSFLPGQFISVSANIDGKAHWRAYSISSSPAQPDTVSITVRRVTGGLVSNWLLDHVRPGTMLNALAPAGDFALAPDDIPPRLALFSAGCGITPMLSMTRWLLDANSPTEIHFFHSARDEANFIFRDTLLALADRHPNLHLHCFLSRPHGELPCHAGRLDAERIRTLLPGIDGMRAYLCGQVAYMDDVTRWLREAGLPETSIIQESFAPLCEAADSDGERFSLHAPAFGRTAEILAGELLLDVLEREGLPIIGACRTGVCGSCKCKVVDGEFETASTTPLTAEEIAAGYVLACSGRARSDLTIELG